MITLRGMTLTIEQRQNILGQRLNGVPVTAVVQATGHGRATVIKVFRDYLAETVEDRREEVEQTRQSLVARHEQAAFTARMEGQRARQDGEHTLHTKYLREERDSLREVARLTGAESAVKVDVSGQVDVTVTDPRDRLTEYLVGLCPSNN